MMWLIKAIVGLFLGFVALCCGYGLLVLVVELCIEFKQARTIVLITVLFSILIALAYFFQ